MAFNDKEQEIIKYGVQSGKTRQEVETAITNYRLGITPTKMEDTKKTPSYLERLTGNVGEDINTRTDRVGEIMKREDTGAIEKGVQVLGQGFGLAANTAEQAVGQIPGIKQGLEKVGEGIQWLSETAPIKALGDKIGGTDTLQELTRLYDTDQNFRDTVDATANFARIYGDATALTDSAVFAKNVTNKLKEVELPTIKTPEIVKNVSKDAIPTVDRIVNTEITKALDLTQGDVKNIKLSTKNDVGEFIANENLIGGTVPETMSKIDDFYKKNYETVRAELDKVTKIYDKNQIPAYKDALGEIKKQVDGKIGLEKVQSEIDQLLTKDKVTLNDVQRAKELMDEHFSLYKMTGDVKEGVVKQGLTNIRKELRSFIEKEVEKNTGADIRELNNKVQTARAIKDAVETRSTRGLTRATISAGDVITFLTGSGFTTPLGGALAVIAKKIYQSPSFKLKLTKWLDSLSDSKRAEIQTQLEKGVVPDELKNQLPSSESSQSKTPNIVTKTRAKKTNIK